MANWWLPWSASNAAAGPITVCSAAVACRPAALNHMTVHKCDQASTDKGLGCGLHMNFTSKLSHSTAGNLIGAEAQLIMSWQRLAAVDIPAVLYGTI